MQDNTYIFNFIGRNYPDEHIAIYLYVCGSHRTSTRSVEIILSDVKNIFCPPLDEDYLETIVIEFLNNKKKQYIKGEITVKPIYS